MPAHIGKWGEISKFMHEVPAVEIELTKNGGLFGDIYIEQPQDIDENYNGYGDLDNVYILPQTLGEKLGVLLGTVRKHLFGPKSISIDNPRYYPNALFLLNGVGF